MSCFAQMAARSCSASFTCRSACCRSIGVAGLCDSLINYPAKKVVAYSCGVALTGTDASLPFRVLRRFTRPAPSKYIHIHIHIHIFYTNTYMHACMHAYIHSTPVQTYGHTYIHTHTHTHTHAHTRRHLLSRMHTDIHTYRHGDTVVIRESREL